MDQEELGLANELDSVIKKLVASTKREVRSLSYVTNGGVIVRLSPVQPKCALCSGALKQKDTIGKPAPGYKQMYYCDDSKCGRYAVLVLDPVQFTKKVDEDEVD